MEHENFKKNNERKQDFSTLSQISNYHGILIKIYSVSQIQPVVTGISNLKQINFMAPFYGWGSTASRLEPLQGGSLLFTTKFPEIPGTHFIDLGRMKG